MLSTVRLACAGLTLGLIVVVLSLSADTATANDNKSKAKPKTAKPKVQPRNQKGSTRPQGNGTGILAIRHDLHDAHHQVRKLRPIYGGHRKSALNEIHLAAVELGKGAHHAKLKVPAFRPGPDWTVKPGVDHPVIRRALHDLKDAHDRLKALPGNFGGHRRAALVHMDRAAGHLVKAIHYVEAQ
jgi:hypothetical protein